MTLGWPAAHTAPRPAAVSAAPDPIDDAIDAWAGAQVTLVRTGLLRALADLDGTALAYALHDLCARGRGTWTSPDTGPRPATHLHEIHLLDAFGAGPTPQEAATSWRTAATALQTPEPTP